MTCGIFGDLKAEYLGNSARFEPVTCREKFDEQKKTGVRNLRVTILKYSRVPVPYLVHTKHWKANQVLTGRMLEIRTIVPFTATRRPNCEERRLPRGVNFRLSSILARTTGKLGGVGGVSTEAPSLIESCPSGFEFSCFFRRWLNL
jgi:hypothetical protein